MFEQIDRFFNNIGGVYVKQTRYLWKWILLFTIILTPILFYSEDFFHISSFNMLLIFLSIDTIISLIALSDIYKVQEMDYRKRRSLLIGLFTSIFIIFIIAAALFLLLSYIIHTYPSVSSINEVLLFYYMLFVFLIGLVYFCAVYGLLSMVSFIVIPSSYEAALMVCHSLF